MRCQALQENTVLTSTARDVIILLLLSILFMEELYVLFLQPVRTVFTTTFSR